jgi:hypothetical protein
VRLPVIYDRSTHSCLVIRVLCLYRTGFCRTNIQLTVRFCQILNWQHLTANHEPICSIKKDMEYTNSLGRPITDADNYAFNSAVVARAPGCPIKSIDTRASESANRLKSVARCTNLHLRYVTEIGNASNHLLGSERTTDESLACRGIRAQSSDSIKNLWQ